MVLVRLLEIQGSGFLDLFEPHLVRPLLKVHVLRVHFSESPELHALDQVLICSKFGFGKFIPEPMVLFTH